MLEYTEELSSFFEINNIVHGQTFTSTLGIVKTDDLTEFSDDTLRNLWLSADEFLELWTCKVFVQLHLASWKWQTVIDLLEQYRDELRYDTSNTTSRTVFEDILQKI